MRIDTWSHWVLQGNEGQDLIEYSVLLGLIALVMVAAALLAGTAISTVFDTVRAYLAGMVT